jgi:O-antigen chain-terminating methyltransferase
MAEEHGVDIGAILNRVRTEADMREENEARPPKIAAPGTVPATGSSPGVGPQAGMGQTTVERLLGFHDEEFIHAAYQHILHRASDPGGLRHYLSLLRDGSLTKLEILVELRLSGEGKRAGAQIPGLARASWTCRIVKIPVIGYLLQLGYSLLRLPVLARNLAKQEAYSAFRFSDVQEVNEELRGQVAGLHAVTSASASMNVVAELQHHLARLEFMKANRKEFADLEERLDSALSLKAGLPEVAALADLMAAKVDLQQVSALADQVAVKADRQEVAALAEGLRVIEAAKADQLHLSAIEDRIAQQERARADPNQLVSLGNDLQTAKRQIAVCRQDLQDQQRRVTLFLEHARKRMPEAFTVEQVAGLVSEERHSLDPLYVAFEDRFRGSRDAIRDGVRIYLPYIQKALLKNKKAPVLDIASGRGEWLELLHEQGYPAKGVDLNRVAVQQCKDLGLDVTEADALEYIRTQPKNRFSAVTCFHYIEHVHYASLVALLDEALRTLKPGGLAIFETPNARNLLVSAGDFYRDPTHRNPVFPDTLESVAELRGFTESAAYYFNDARTALIPLSEHRFDDLQDYIRVSRDVVWIGVKPS